MNNFIKKINFKKCIIVYITISILVGTSLIIFIGSKFKNKLEFIYNYHNISEELEKSNYNLNSIKEKIKTMSKNSEDVVDVLILNKENKIIYSSKNSEFAKQEDFTLIKADDMSSKYFKNSNNDNIIFRLTTNQELIINTVLSNFDTEIQKEYIDEVFYKSNFDNEKIY